MCLCSCFWKDREHARNSGNLCGTISVLLGVFVMKLNSYITWKLKLNKTNTLNYFFIKCIILDTKKKIRLSYLPSRNP